MATKSITFNCEIITPMFIGNAIPGQAELRPSAIKGALRFWWRAMKGGLDLDELRKQEAEIFGSADEEKGGRSKVLIEILKCPDRIDNGLPANHHFTTKMYGKTRKGNRTDVDIIKFLAYGSEIKDYYNVHEINNPSTFIFKLVFGDSSIEPILKDVVNFISVFGGLGSKCRNGFGRFVAFVDNEPLEDIRNVLKRYESVKKADYTALSDSISLYELNGGPYLTWHDLLAGLGTAYKTAKELTGDTPHDYEKRVIIGAPIKKYSHRHSKTHFFGIARSANKLNGTILFLPYNYLKGSDKYLGIEPAKINQWQTDYAKVTTKFNNDLINMTKVTL